VYPPGFGRVLPRALVEVLKMAYELNSQEQTLYSTVMDAKERRREPRYPTDAGARVVLLGDDARTVEARVDEVSRSGIKLHLPIRLSKGDKVRVEFGKTIAFAEVRWCRQHAEEDFEAGMLIDHTMALRLLSRIRQAAGAETDEEQSD
jgi:hypothetical protein